MPVPCPPTAQDVACASCRPPFDTYRLASARTPDSRRAASSSVAPAAPPAHLPGLPLWSAVECFHSPGPKAPSAQRLQAWRWQAAVRCVSALQASLIQPSVGNQVATATATAAQRVHGYGNSTSPGSSQSRVQYRRRSRGAPDWTRQVSPSSSRNTSPSRNSARSSNLIIQVELPCAYVPVARPRCLAPA